MEIFLVLIAVLALAGIAVLIKRAFRTKKKTAVQSPAVTTAGLHMAAAGPTPTQPDCCTSTPAPEINYDSKEALYGRPTSTPTGTETPTSTSTPAPEQPTNGGTPAPTPTKRPKSTPAPEQPTPTPAEPPTLPDGTTPTPTPAA